MALTGCAVTVEGTPRADPAATTTTTTTTTTEAEPPIDPDDGPLITGTDTLDNPTIATAKTGQGVDFCNLLNPQDIQQALGLTQSGPQPTDNLCTTTFAEGGFVYVSQIGTSFGQGFELRGNSALLLQRDEFSCQVTVALNPTSPDTEDVLDIDARLVVNQPVPICDGVRELANRAFQRLPAA